MSRKLVDGCVAITIKLEAPLPPYSVDGDDPEAEGDPFESVFRDFAILHTVTEATAEVRANPSVLFTPSAARKCQSRLIASKRTTGTGIAMGVDTIPPDVVNTLPSFCFPDGAKVLPAKPTVGASAVHSFAISESGYFATCVTFYRETDARPFWLAYECIRPRQSSSAADAAGFRLHSIFDKVGAAAGDGGGDGGDPASASSSRPATIFMPYCICLVSRLPYLGVMKDVLESILPRVENNDNLGEFLCGVMSDLARVPPPPNGAAALQFRLREQFCASDPRYIVCKPPPLVDLPIIDTPLRYLLMILPPASLLTVIESLLTEQRVIFVSSEYARLTPMIEALLALIYPFKWQHVYIPVIPAHLRAFIDAPWPYLIGIHARYIDEILLECASQDEQPIVVNFDTRTVTVPAAIVIPKLPAAETETFVARCGALQLDFELKSIGRVYLDPALADAARERHGEELQTEIRAIFLGLMLALFGDIRRHIMFDISPPVLNLDKFLASKPAESEQFYRVAITASSFRLFQRSRHKHERDYFDLAAAREMGLPACDASFVFSLPDFSQTPMVRRSSAPTETFHTMLEPTRETSGNPSGPAASADGAMPNYQRFYDKAISQLSGLISRPSCPCMCQLLHLRAVFHVLHGDVLQGLNDFDAIMKVEAASFPKDLVLDILKFQQPDMIQIVSRRGPTWASLVEKLERDNSSENRDSRLMTPSNSLASPRLAADEVRLPEVGGESQVLDALEKGKTVDRKSFNAICDLLGITDSATVGNNLYTSLRCQGLPPGEGDSNDGLPVELFTQFIEIWNGLLDRKDTVYPGLELDDDDEIVKTVSMVRRSDTGMSTLILTHKRCILIPNNNPNPVQVCELNRIISVDKCQYKVFIPPGVPALRVFTQEPRDPNPAAKRPSGIKRRTSSSANKAEDVIEQMLLFFNERDAWHGYLMEMAMAHKAASATKDPSLVFEAARNVTLAEAVLMLTKEARSLDPEVAAEAVKRMMPLSNPVKLLRLVSETSHPYFVKKIDSSPNQTRKSTVECILFMPSGGSSDDDTFGTVWCGLGSGFIQILEMPTGVVECRMKAHKDRVTCLLSIGDHVWSGSFDASILIIDTRTRRSVAVLDGIDDAVGSMFKDGDTVWVTTLGGNLTQWNTKTHECLHRIDVAALRGKASSIRTCTRIQNLLWSGTGTVIIILDLETGKIKRRRRSAILGDGVLGASEIDDPGLPSPVVSDQYDALPEDVQDEAPESPRVALGTPAVTAARRAAPASQAANTPYPEIVTEPGSSEPSIDASFVLRTSASHCIIAGIENEVWSCSNVSGLLHVWDARTFSPVKMGGEWRLDCRGFNVLLATETAIWGGANNGSVYMWDPESHSLLQQLTSHSDGVRSLCAMGARQFVLSGSGSNDGTLVVWKQPGNPWG